MAAFAYYGSDSDDDSVGEGAGEQPTASGSSAAPVLLDVAIDSAPGLHLQASASSGAGSGGELVASGTPSSSSSATSAAGNATAGQIVGAGRVQEAHVDAWDFKRYYNLFQGHGVALAPGSESGSTLVTEKLGLDRKFKPFPKPGEEDEGPQQTDAEREAEREQERAANRAAAQQQLQSMSSAADVAQGGKRTRKELREAMRERRVALGKYLRDQSRYVTAVEAGTLTALQRRSRLEMGLPLDELHESERGMGSAAGVAPGAGPGVGDSLEAPGRKRRRTDTGGTGGGKTLEACEFILHAKAASDYQGRAWTAPPSGLRLPDEPPKGVAPRRLLHRYTGHTKGVNWVEFLPSTGHLLLTAGLDGNCKVWATGGDRRVLGTYKGHTAGVRQARFDPSGEQFYSAGYDGFVKVWDVATGKAVASLGDGSSAPVCVSPYPKDGRVALVGMQDKRILQYDTRAPAEPVQVYDYHLSAVNSITFCDSDRRFVSTSDDKKILAWDYDVPVPIKYISDHTMHAIPSAALHPSGDFLVGQSMDNTIVCYAVAGFRLNRKKVYRGHISAGFACQPCFSPAGNLLASGDSKGRLFVWDWKRKRVVSSIQAHERQPCIGAAWHPADGGIMATSGWDGEARLWGVEGGRAAARAERDEAGEGGGAASGRGRGAEGAAGGGGGGR